MDMTDSEATTERVSKTEEDDNRQSHGGGLNEETLWFRAQAIRLAILIKARSGLHWVEIEKIPGLERAKKIRNLAIQAKHDDYVALKRYADLQGYSEASVHASGNFIYNLVPDKSHFDDAITYAGQYLHFSKSIDLPGSVSVANVDLMKEAWDDRLPKYSLTRRNRNNERRFLGGYIKTGHELILLGSQIDIIDVRTHFFRISKDGPQDLLGGLVNGVSHKDGSVFSGPCCMLKHESETPKLGYRKMSEVARDYPQVKAILDEYPLITIPRPQLD